MRACVKNPFPIDQCFVVSIAALREICQSLSESGEKKWQVVFPEHTVERGYDFKNVHVRYNNPSGSLENHISYTFPVVAQLPLFKGEEGEMACLYSLAARSKESAFYMDGDELCHDDIGDWEAFWFPLEAKLTARLKK